MRNEIFVFAEKMAFQTLRNWDKVLILRISKILRSEKNAFQTFRIEKSSKIFLRIEKSANILLRIEKWSYFFTKYLRLTKWNIFPLSLFHWPSD